MAIKDNGGIPKMGTAASGGGAKMGNHEGGRDKLTPGNNNKKNENNNPLQNIQQNSQNKQGDKQNKGNGDNQKKSLADYTKDERKELKNLNNKANPFNNLTKALEGHGDSDKSDSELKDKKGPGSAGVAKGSAGANVKKVAAKGGKVAAHIAKTVAVAIFSNPIVITLLAITLIFSFIISAIAGFFTTETTSVATYYNDPLTVTGSGIVVADETADEHVKGYTQAGDEAAEYYKAFWEKLKKTYKARPYSFTDTEVETSKGTIVFKFDHEEITTEDFFNIWAYVESYDMNEGMKKLKDKQIEEASNAAIKEENSDNEDDSDATDEAVSSGSVSDELPAEYTDKYGFFLNDFKHSKEKKKRLEKLFKKSMYFKKAETKTVTETKDVTVANTKTVKGKKVTTYSTKKVTKKKKYVYIHNLNLDDYVNKYGFKDKDQEEWYKYTKEMIAYIQKQDGGKLNDEYLKGVFWGYKSTDNYYDGYDLNYGFFANLDEGIRKRILAIASCAIGQYGVGDNAKVPPSICIAQSYIESGIGNPSICNVSQRNNWLGLGPHNKYPSLADCVADYYGTRYQGSDTDEGFYHYTDEHNANGKYSKKQFWEDFDISKTSDASYVLGKMVDYNNHSHYCTDTRPQIKGSNGQYIPDPNSTNPYTDEGTGEGIVPVSEFYCKKFPEAIAKFNLSIFDKCVGPHAISIEEAVAGEGGSICAFAEKQVGKTKMELGIGSATDSTPWCAKFASICMTASDCYRGVEGSPSCQTLRDNFKAAGRYHEADSGYVPQPGDIVFFVGNYEPGWTHHVGIYIRPNQDGGIVTVEGNNDPIHVVEKSYSKEIISSDPKASEYVLGYGSALVPESDDSSDNKDDATETSDTSAKKSSKGSKSTKKKK